MYVPRVKWSSPGKGVALPLYLSVVAIEKGAFLSPLTPVANFTTYILFISYINIYNMIVSVTLGFILYIFIRQGKVCVFF